MSDTPDDLHYAETHEWARLEENNIISIGISDHAQEALGDVVYVELPEVGTEFSASDTVGVLESVKAASDYYCPADGEVVEVNALLDEEPGTINASPYHEGWLFKLQLSNEDLSHLLDAEAYRAVCEQ